MENDPHWGALCAALDIPETCTLEEVATVATMLRAEADIQLAGIQAAGAYARRAAPVLQAAEGVYRELLLLGRYRPGEDFSAVRSDRWPPEVDLVAAMDKFLTEDVVAAG